MNGVDEAKSVEQRYAEHEHREIRAGLDLLGTAARAVGVFPSAVAADAIERATYWIHTVLQPHAEWEDKVMYADVDERAGTPWATKLMRFEHGQIARAAMRLERDADLTRAGVSHDDACSIRARLSGLETLIRAHVEREEAFLLPLLDD